MELLPPEIATKIPPLYLQEGAGKNAVAHIKIFAPWARATWLLLEYDGGDILFVWADLGHGGELGYASLAELKALRGPLGQHLERDLSFDPKALRNAIADHRAYR